MDMKLCALMDLEMDKLGKRCHQREISLVERESDLGFIPSVANVPHVSSTISALFFPTSTSTLFALSKP